MITLELETEPQAKKVIMRAHALGVELTDGHQIIVPLDWYPRLLHGTPRERKDWQLLGEGYAIESPDLDEHIGIDGIVAGRRSSESAKSLKRWLATRKRAPRTVVTPAQRSNL